MVDIVSNLLSFPLFIPLISERNVLESLRITGDGSVSLCNALRFCSVYFEALFIKVQIYLSTHTFIYIYLNNCNIFLVNWPLCHQVMTQDIHDNFCSKMKLFDINKTRHFSQNLCLYVTVSSSFYFYPIYVIVK